MQEAASGSETEGQVGESARAIAFRSLARQHLDASYRLANAILGNPAEAEDAVHDAFITAWRKWEDLRDPAKFDAWFKRIVVNTCRDRLRRRTRTATSDISEHGSLATPDHSGAANDRVLLEQALSHLKPDDQVLIVLRYDHDLKLGDIAEMLGIPTGTVKRRLNTAHKRLRSVMERPEGSSR
jgi:RNA polymerase sigma-70 factor (ECF subfamily)